MRCLVTVMGYRFGKSQSWRPRHWCTRGLSYPILSYAILSHNVNFTYTCYNCLLVSKSSVCRRWRPTGNGADASSRENSLLYDFADGDATVALPALHGYNADNEFYFVCVCGCLCVCFAVLRWKTWACLNLVLKRIIEL